MPVTKEQIEKCAELVKQYGASKLVLFGSALENLETAHDLDLACDGVDGWNFFELGALLEEIVSAPVDLIPLRPPTRFSKYIEKQGKIIYQI